MIAYWDHSHIYIVYDFSQLSLIWGNLCGGNSVSVLPYAHQQLFKVFNTLYMYDMDVGCSLKSSIVQPQR